MISVTDLRAGTIFKDNGNLLQVLAYEHIKMGRGSANIKVKVKNLRSGSTTEKSFINGAKVDDLTVLKREYQYLYKDEDNAYFMDPQTYEQISVSQKVIDGSEFLKEGNCYSISFLDAEPLSIILPPKVVLTVIETAPGVKGNSATNVFKNATLENGLTTKVPPFIGIGDKVRIDTRTGAYTEKA
jgi:elongation factor P